MTTTSAFRNQSLIQVATTRCGEIVARKKLQRFISRLAAAAASFLTLTLVLASSFANAQQPARPNVLFIIFDDWNGSTHAGAYGCTWIKTPNFDRIAREGVLFKNAFTSNPKCSPCRASILTGRNTWQLREAVSHNGLFPAGFEVYPDLLEQAGYFVGLTGKGWGPGDFRTQAKRTRNPAGPNFDRLTQDPPANGIGRNDYPGNFAEFLKARPKDKPFCFWMGFTEPHRAYEYGSGERLGKKLAEIKVPAFLPDTEIVRRDLADYAIEVEWGDQQIGRALKMLEEAGELENTLIVVTSDHGMPFPFVKGQIHEDAFHLPLAMRWGKGIKPGRVVEDFVNVRDLAPTYLELAGLAPHAQMTGKSLANILRSEHSGWIENRDVMLAGKERHDIGRPNDLGYPVRAIRTRDFLYVHNFHPERWPAGNPETDFGNVDGSPTKEVIKALGGHYYELSLGKRLPDELYRITDDPECVRNLANDLAFKDILEEHRYKLMSMLKEEGDPRALGKGDEVFDTYEYTAGRGKGYETWLAQQEATALKELDSKLKAAKAAGKAKKAKK
jgi:N-sulfoglucosamine sulfohydrolase